MSNQLEPISVRLRDEAARLGSGSVPLHLLHLLKELGLGLRIARSRDENHKGDLRRGEAGWEIVVVRPSRGPIEELGLSNQERYTIAHEISHYLVEAWFGFRPSTSGEYWALEEVCDEFADRLLVSDQLLAGLDPNLSAHQLVGTVKRLARRAGAPPKATAKRVIQTRRDACAALGIRLDPLQSSGRMGWIEWVAENRPWIGTQRRAIYDDAPLAAALESPPRDPILPGCLDVATEHLRGKRSLMAAILAPEVMNLVGQRALARDRTRASRAKG